MTEPFDARQHIRDLLARGWRRCTSHSDMIHHPEDYAMQLRYNPLTDTLSISPELERRLDLVILTKRGQGKALKR